ncbi:Fcf2p [Sugiyamaella lignohabitans]|uniref:Fcf2p n=1 Tax=Sugiyamaella lignohabitans TaxID=796027 RepID=A0A167FE26_9ASCO|nr:Fcf2p [Sugiyamaella lignohabitans]ANB15183.1 Fcf2p [Sugiyamaella lignohabitans]
MRTRSQTKDDDHELSSDISVTNTPTRKTKANVDSPAKKQQQQHEPEFSIDNEDDLDKLLAQAKKNLTTKKSEASKAVDSEPEVDMLTETFARENQGPSATFKEIQRSWKLLPKLDPGLDNVHTVKIDPKSKSVVRLVPDVSPSARPQSSSTATFRKIVDPVKVAKQEKEERESNAGDKWFNMPKPELTPTLKRDLKLLKMRNVLDPKRHYKKDNSPLPKYFQTGTVIEGNTEFYSARLSRKERRQTIADEILADVSSKAYFKRKYTDIQGSKTSGRKAHYKKLKQMRKKL